MNVQAFYTMAELARLCGVDADLLARVLKDADVPIHPAGRDRIVYLSDIKEHLPELYDSALERASICGI